MLLAIFIHFAGLLDQQQPAAQSSDLSSVLISGVLGGGGVAIIGAVFKGYNDIRKSKTDAVRDKADNSKAIEEATSSVVTLLNAELQSQSGRFNETIKWLEVRRQELVSENFTLEQRCENLENRLNELVRWRTKVEMILGENNIPLPNLVD